MNRPNLEMRTPAELSRRMRPDRTSLIAACATGIAIVMGAAAGPSATVAQRGGVHLVSRPIFGTSGGLNTRPSISDDGLLVAFASDAPNLVAGDTNGVEDVFLYERPGDSVRRISLSPIGTEVTVPSMMPSLSPDGRWLALRSDADLMSDGGGSGLFLLDLWTGDRYRIAADTAHRRGIGSEPTVSRDGRRVAFLSNIGADGTTVLATVGANVWDRSQDAIAVVSPSGIDEAVVDVTISDDGGTVAFSTAAGGIVGAGASGAVQVYARSVDVDDRARWTIGPPELISVAFDGKYGVLDSFEPSLSADGSLIAFTSYASNLVPIDTNGVSDVFVRDRNAVVTTAVTTVDPPDDDHHPGDSAEPDMAPDGERLVFASSMRNLVADDRNVNWDIFVHDRTTGAMQRVNRAWDGKEADRDSRNPALASVGVAFESFAALAPEDADNEQDIYYISLHAAPEHPSLTPTLSHTPDHPSPTPTHSHTPDHPTTTPTTSHGTPSVTPGAHPTTPPPIESPGAHLGWTIWLPACGGSLSRVDVGLAED